MNKGDDMENWKDTKKGSCCLFGDYSGHRILDFDEMNEQFQILAQMDIPSKFISIENITKEAGEYMQEAVSLYHELYESETYDEEKATAAAENYSRAMKRITIISEVLQGEIPDGEGIHITEETATDFEPVREDTDF